MNKILKVFFILIFSFLIGSYALADYCKCNGGTTSYDQSTCSKNATTEGCQWMTGSSGGGTVSLPNPLGTGNPSIPTLLGSIINSVLGVIGSLALVMFIYGGAIWMLSGGNQERVTKGKQIIIWAALGIIIIFSAYALAKFLLTTVTMTNS